MPEIRFEELPPAPLNSRTDRQNFHARAADALRSRPKEWALVKTAGTAQAASAAAHQIKSGRLKAYNPPGTFEATARKVDGEYRVYVRYVGEAGESRG